VGIAEQDVAAVRSAVDMVALVGEHVALRQQGGRWKGLCPFHSERTPSFSLNPTLGLYYCFGCGASGDAITFVRATQHLDFPDAVEVLAARAGITLHASDARASSRRRWR
jgi:DNA primase